MSPSAPAAPDQPWSGDSAERAPPRSDANRLVEFFRYHGVWAPGVRLFRAIGFRAKAGIITVMFLAPLSVLAWSYFSDKAADIEFSARERLGVAYLRDAAPLLPLLQKERQLVLLQVAKGGEPPALADVRQAIEAQMKKLAATEAALGATLATAPAHAALLEAGRALPAPSAGLDKNLAAHNERLRALQLAITAAADNSNLTLDPDLDSYYLMEAVTSVLPVLVESTAQLQAIAMAVASGAPASGDMAKALHAQEAIGDYSDGRWAAGVEKVQTLHAEVKPALDFDATRKALHGFHALAEQSESVSKLQAGGDAALAGLMAAYTKSLEMLDGLLEQRIAALRNGRSAVTALLGVSLLLALYLFMAFRKVLDGGLKEVAFHIDAMRDGDLTTQPRAWGADEAARLMHTLSQMQAALRRIVGQVRGASDSIVSASTQIASGAQDLSARTEQSAANLEETASAMEQISATVRRGQATVDEATVLAGANAEAAERGGRIVAEVVQTMQHINESSGRIGEIIGTIDGIAFQTNILALNAAVEAARAGDQGRGFAVVAAEVRALAQRSAQAAREIKTLIGASVAEADSGVRIVRQAGDAIGEIVSASQRVRALLQDVATGAREQTAGVSQSARAVQDLDAVTQQNAALVEQTAAAAGSLQGQAQGLAGEVARFRLPA